MHYLRDISPQNMKSAKETGIGKYIHTTRNDKTKKFTNPSVKKASEKSFIVPSLEKKLFFTNMKRNMSYENNGNIDGINIETHHHS